MNWFWAKVLFCEFIRHYRKMTDEAIVADVRASMDDLEALNADGETFGAFMVRKAESRANMNRARYAEYGKLGGRPRKRPQDFDSTPGGAPSGDVGDASARTTAHGQGPDHPPDTVELYAFAAENGLDEIDAREWYEMSEKRGWRDRYGNPIRDWKLACEAYCARKALNRLKKEIK